MISRRGITLVELLATLSLLAILMVVSVSWMTTVLRSQARSTDQADWSRASLAVLDQIGQDVHTVDRLDVNARRNSPRITTEGNILQIRTRDDRGVGVQRYAFDSNAKSIRRQRDDDRSRTGLVALLGETRALQCFIELPSEERAMPVLKVSIIADDGREVHRTYILDHEDVQ